jgi:putative transposase
MDQKNMESTQSKQDRRAMLDWNNKKVPFKTQVDILSLNRSPLYYKLVEPTTEEVNLHHDFDGIYTRHPVYGSRRITVELLRQGWIINRKRVQRCMRELVINGICPGPI